MLMNYFVLFVYFVEAVWMRCASRRHTYAAEPAYPLWPRWRVSPAGAGEGVPPFEPCSSPKPEVSHAP